MDPSPVVSTVRELTVSLSRRFLSDVIRLDDENQNAADLSIYTREYITITCTDDAPMYGRSSFTVKRTYGPAPPGNISGETNDSANVSPNGYYHYARSRVIFSAIDPEDLRRLGPRVRFGTVASAPAPFRILFVFWGTFEHRTPVGEEGDGDAFQLLLIYIYTRVDTPDGVVQT